MHPFFMSQSVSADLSSVAKKDSAQHSQTVRGVFAQGKEGSRLSFQQIFEGARNEKANATAAEGSSNNKSEDPEMDGDLDCSLHDDSKVGNEESSEEVLEVRTDDQDAPGIETLAPTRTDQDLVVTTDRWPPERREQVWLWNQSDRDHVLQSQWTQLPTELNREGSGNSPTSGRAETVFDGRLVLPLQDGGLTRLELPRPSGSEASNGRIFDAMAVELAARQGDRAYDDALSKTIGSALEAAKATLAKDPIRGFEVPFGVERTQTEQQNMPRPIGEMIDGVHSTSVQIGGLVNSRQSLIGQNVIGSTPSPGLPSPPDRPAQSFQMSMASALPPSKNQMEANVLSKDLLATSPLEISPSQISPQGSIPSRADLPVHIARQLAEVVHHLPSRPVEITLSPEELGRVRLSITHSEQGIIFNVLAERPETLDLMRRHIGQLAQEFRSMGYEDIAFSFSSAEQGPSDGDGQQHPENSTQQTAQDPIGDDVKSTQIHLSDRAQNGLDLRL